MPRKILYEAEVRNCYPDENGEYQSFEAIRRENKLKAFLYEDEKPLLTVIKESECKKYVIDLLTGRYYEKQNLGNRLIHGEYEDICDTLLYNWKNIKEIWNEYASENKLKKLKGNEPKINFRQEPDFSSSYYPNFEKREYEIKVYENSNPPVMKFINLKDQKEVEIYLDKAEYKVSSSWLTKKELNIFLSFVTEKVWRDFISDHNSYFFRDKKDEDFSIKIKKMPDYNFLEVIDG